MENEAKIKNKKVKERRNGSNAFLTATISLFVGAIVMYLLVYFVIPIDNSNTIINRSEKEVTVTDAGIADAVEKLYDAVVVVQVYNNNTIASSGTGFVYRVEKNKAFILTNNHVVNNGGNKIMVQFTNGQAEEVKVEGTDEYSDLAVLSLAADKVISVADIGKSEENRLGDTVFTIGAPLDTEYYWTVTRGILSGKDRMVEVSLSNSTSGSDYVMKVLQTDASINSGNSGGPLANSNGEVIGITNMKLVSDGVEGIGFAIPIEDAIEFADAIISGEEIKKPLLGVSMLNLTERYYLYQEGITLNTELTSGVVVVEVQDGSPADKAGLKRGDIIVSLGEEKTDNVASLRYNLYKHYVGDTVIVKFERNGKMESSKLKLSVAAE